jgi:DNA-binding MarR family transcriptional regulator
MAERSPTLRSQTATTLATQLRDSITRINRRMRQTRPAGDLTVAQVSALRSLETAGALTPRELADIERVQPPTMTRIVARLEESGLVQRTPHPADGRQVILALTPAGRGLMADYGHAREEWLGSRLAALTPEERDLVQRAAEVLARIARD